LAALPAEEQREVWKEAATKAKEENREPTGKDVQRVIEQRKQPSLELQVESQPDRPKGKKKFSEVQLDAWIDVVRSWLKDGERVSIALLMGNKRNSFNVEQMYAIFDEMVDRGLVEDECYVEPKGIKLEPSRSYPDGATRDVDSSSGPDEEPQLAKTEPQVLKLAKKIFEIGMEAGGLHGKWATAGVEAQIGFIAIARWHLGEIFSLANVVDEEAEFRSQRKIMRVKMHEGFRHPLYPGLRLTVTGWIDGSSKNPHRWGVALHSLETETLLVFKSREECEKVLGIQIAEFEEEPQKESGAMFVICREAKRQKPKYWSGPNAWTNDPSRAKHLARKAAGARLTATKGFASCKKDFMMALPKALKRFESQA
jgi:hypothetical protein